MRVRTNRTLRPWKHSVILSGSELQLVVAELCSVLRMNEQTLSCLPLAGMPGALDADHLHLAVDGPSKSSARDGQEGVGVDVSEAHRIVAQPLAGAADHLPVVATVADAVFAITRDLLLAGQRALEVVRVQIAFGGHVLQPDMLTALDDCPAKKIPHSLRLNSTTTLSLAYPLSHDLPSSLITAQWLFASSCSSVPVTDCWPDPVPYLTSCECNRTR